MLTEGKAVVLFDGVCNLCNGVVQFIIRHDANQKFMFASLQSDYARKLLLKQAKDPDILQSVIVYDGQQLFTKSDAALFIAKYLTRPWSWLAYFKILPRFVRNGVYDIISRYRYKVFGKRDSCMMPSPENRDRFLV